MAAKFWYCHYHDKRTWKSGRTAKAEADKTNRVLKATGDEATIRIHWCAQAGGYHHTSQTEQEFNRKQATLVASEEHSHGRAHENFRKWRERERRRAHDTERLHRDGRGRRPSR